MTTKYCLGFYFSEDFERVLLIKKNRPAFLKGKFSGIGGHVEEGERERHAMIREFREETGIDTYLADWTFHGTQTIGDFDTKSEIYVFFGFGDLSQAQSTTDEPVYDVALADIANYNVDDLAKWLINSIIERVNERSTSRV